MARANSAFISQQVSIMSKNDNGKLDFSKLFGQVAAVFKSVPEDKLADLADALDHAGAARIPDMWNEPRGEHKAPSRAEIVTGPAEPMSSRGADKMIREYSDLASQSGLTEVYASFERILADFSKSMKADFDRRFTPLAEVVSDLVKAQSALDQVLKAAQEAETAQKAAEPAEETFFGKAQSKLTAARKAFRKAEMEEDEDEREERKARLTKINDMLKSVLKLISKSEDEEKNDDEEVEKAVASVKSLQSKVTAALGVITKAEEDEKKEEDEAEKSHQPAEATKKAEDEEKEEEKDDTAKSIAALTAQLTQVQEALKGNVVLKDTVTSLIEKVSGMSKGGLATPPNLAVIKGGMDPEASVPAAIDANEITGDAALLARTLLMRRRAVTAGNYEQSKFNSDLAAAPASVRRHFAA